MSIQNCAHAPINPFTFSEAEVRTAIGENDEPLFCAKDVCQILDIKWSGSGTTLENMPEKWFCTLNLRGQRGTGEVVFINEAGLYHLVFRSNKPNAKEFAGWVCEEVLPQLRKYGFYGKVAVKDYIALNKQITQLALQLARTKNSFAARVLYDQLKDYCNIIGKPLPAIEFIRQEIDQSDLFLEHKGV